MPNPLYAPQTGGCTADDSREDDGDVLGDASTDAGWLGIEESGAQWSARESEQPALRHWSRNYFPENVRIWKSRADFVYANARGAEIIVGERRPIRIATTTQTIVAAR